jgi:hypothetical protein
MTPDPLPPDVEVVRQILGLDPDDPAIQKLAEIRKHAGDDPHP